MNSKRRSAAYEVRDSNLPALSTPTAPYSCSHAHFGSEHHFSLSRSSGSRMPSGSPSISISTQWSSSFRVLSQYVSFAGRNCDYRMFSKISSTFLSYAYFNLLTLLSPPINSGWNASDRNFRRPLVPKVYSPAIRVIGRFCNANTTREQTCITDH